MLETIKNVQQILEIDNVEAVVVTDTLVNDDASRHARAIKILGKPQHEHGEQTLILEIRLLSSARDNIEIKTPNLYF